MDGPKVTRFCLFFQAKALNNLVNIWSLYLGPPDPRVCDLREKDLTIDTYYELRGQPEPFGIVWKTETMFRINWGSNLYFLDQKEVALQSKDKFLEAKMHLTAYDFRTAVICTREWIGIVRTSDLTRINAITLFTETDIQVDNEIYIKNLSRNEC